MIMCFSFNDTRTLSQYLRGGQAPHLPNHAQGKLHPKASDANRNQHHCAVGTEIEKAHPPFHAQRIFIQKPTMRTDSTASARTELNPHSAPHSVANPLPPKWRALPRGSRFHEARSVAPTFCAKASAGAARHWPWPAAAGWISRLRCFPDSPTGGVAESIVACTISYNVCSFVLSFSDVQGQAT